MQFVRKITQSKHLFFCEVCLPDGLQLSGGRRLLVFSSARKKKECSKFTKQNVLQKQMYQETNKAGLFGVFWVQGFWGSFFGESWGLLFVCFLVLLLLLLSLGFVFFLSCDHIQIFEICRLFSLTYPLVATEISIWIWPPMHMTVRVILKHCL